MDLPTSGDLQAKHVPLGAISFPSHLAARIQSSEASLQGCVTEVLVAHGSPRVTPLGKALVPIQSFIQAMAPLTVFFEDLLSIFTSNVCEDEENELFVQDF